jgi:anti-anti-sigma regulatory factor
VVFSLFSRKDKPDPRKGREPMPRVPDSTQRGPATSPGAGTPHSQREIARRTAEKIDQIESEMIAAGLPVPPPPKRVQDQIAAAKAAGAAPIAPGAGLAPGAPPTMPALEHSTSVVLGDTANAGEIHVNGSNLPPDLEEAAILYANGQMDASIATLKRAIARGDLGASAQQAFLMLLDVYHGADQRASFDDLALDYAARFEQSPPGWRDIPRAAPAAAKGAANATTIAFPASVDAAVAKQIEAVQRAAATKRPVTLDFGAVTRVDLAGGTLLLRTIEAFKKARRELVLAGVPTLHEAVRGAIETGRRDEGEGCWMLALETLRVQGLKQQFDDLSIDYCVTFEVSPPPWEPMPEWVRTDSSSGAGGRADAVVSVEAPGGFALRGEITGRMQKELAALRAYAQEHNQVLVDCRDLTRLDFVAAGELLNEVVSLRAQGRAVLFAEPNYIVLALMLVMGIHELADIRRRRI